MELRYCESCGEVSRLEDEAQISLTEQFICVNCKGSDDGANRSHPAAQPTDLEELTLKAAADGQDLNLFSTQTIAVRRPRSPQAKGDKEGRPDQPTAKSSTRLKLVKSPQEDPGSPAATAPPSASVAQGGGNQPPRKLGFSCLYCGTSLAIRPVKKISKCHCPKCQKDLYVTTTGRVTKGVPSSRKQSFVMRNSGSVAIRKERHSASASPSTPTVDAPLAGQDETSLADCPLKTSNPASPVRERPRSAFEDHQDLPDPNKTCFISEETTTDLRALVDSELLAQGVGEEESPLPPEKPKTGKSREKSAAGKPPKLRPKSAPPVTRPSGVTKATRPAQRTAPKTTPMAVLVRCLLLTIVIAVPVLATSALLSRGTHAQSASGEAAAKKSPSVVLERMGTIAKRGLQRLLGDQ